jgi:hypothetical protein
MLKRRLFVLLGVIVGITASSAVAADPRDSVDRGDRLDTNALRDDISTNRLQVPAHPLVITPPVQPAPTPRGKKKSNASGGSGR